MVCARSGISTVSERRSRNRPPAAPDPPARPGGAAGAAVTSEPEIRVGLAVDGEGRDNPPPRRLSHATPERRSRHSASTASASAPGSRARTTKPSTPDLTASVVPPESVATTGRPHAIASSVTFGMPSLRLACSSTWAAAADRERPRGQPIAELDSLRQAEIPTAYGSAAARLARYRVVRVASDHLEPDAAPLSTISRTARARTRSP